MIVLVKSSAVDVSTWRPDLAEGYLAGQAMERRIRRQRHRNVAVLGAALAILAAVVPLEVRSVWQFGAWMPWATPHHIVHCGQTYRQVAGSDVVPLSREHVQDLRRVMSGPHFQAVHASGFEPCGPDLFLRSGSGYLDYSDGLYG